MRLFLLLATFLVYTEHSMGQSDLADSLLKTIADKQTAVTSDHYQKGMFPSQRLYLPLKKAVREDDNIFFTGLIVWTLKSIYPNLSATNQKLVDSICAGATSNYMRYQNKDGRPVYNFWQTRPSRHFPNSKYFSSRRKYIIPDDMDDTSIIYLSESFSDSLKKIVKAIMAENANGQKRVVRNTLRRYKKVPAYSTWFGKNMPVDFDICVQANGLRFVLDNGFELNKYDSATLGLIKNMVQSGIYIRRPHFVAPHYQNAAIILYHVSRLVAAHPEQPVLAEIKGKLIDDLNRQMQKSKNGMERILLQTSLMKMGQQYTEPFAVSEKEIQRFYFFMANMTSVFPNPIKGIFAKSKKTNFFYRSEAYYLALLLEHEVLRLAAQKS